MYRQGQPFGDYIVRAVSLISLTGVSLMACTPQKLMSVDNAQVVCTERARDAVRPQGDVYVGVGSGGADVGVGIGVSTDLLLGRNPETVYNECVKKKSGQAPSAPLQL